MILNEENVDQTPLHFAARSKALNNFKLLIEMGANPFIKNRQKKDSISILLDGYNIKIFNYITNTNYFKANFYNGKYLFELLSNNISVEYIINFIKKSGLKIINMSNKKGQNLFLYSCKNDNTDVVKFLLENGANLNIKDIEDNTFLHYLAFNNSINSAYLIFKFLEKYNKNKIPEYLKAKNKLGNTVFHSCCINNKKDFLLILIEFMQKNYPNLKLNRNNNQLTPIQEALINNNYEYAQLMYDILELKEEEIIQVGDEFKSEIINNLNTMKKRKTNINIKKIFEQLCKNEIKIDYNINLDSKDSNYELFIKKISKFYTLKKCTKNTYIKYESIFGHPIFLQKLYNLAEKGLGELIDYFFEIINLKIDMNKAFKNIVKFYIGFIFVNCEYNDFPDILNNLDYVLFSYLKNLNSKHPIFDWIQSIIISYYQIEENIKTSYILNLIKKFIDIIKTLYLIDVIKFTKVSDISFRFIHNLCDIILNMDKKMALIQVKRIDMIPPILTSEIKLMKSKYNIINRFAFSENPIHGFCSKALRDKNASAEYIDAVIDFTVSLEDSNILNYQTKIKINNLFKNKFYSCLDIDLLNCFSNIEKIILNFGNKTIINDIMPIIEQKQITAKIFYAIMGNLSSVNNMDEFKEKIKLLNQNNLQEFYKTSKKYYFYDNLSEILDSFKNVNLFNTEKIYPLPDYDLSQLKEFGSFLEKSKKYSRNELITEGLKLGSIFRSSPNMENLANLVSIIISGFIEVMNIKPYLIQCLSVASFCLFFVNERWKKNLKGRMAQIATGEGKSIIIAMLALVTSLQGYYTDIITSNAYLAQFAQNKFKVLFDSFGITSSNISKDPIEKEYFNAMIIYGTNTDFEFTLLREGIHSKDTMISCRNRSKIKEKRNYEVIIIDEVDNLFIDTSLNSARISYHSNINYIWVYQPIYNYISSTQEKQINIQNLVNYFKTYNGGEYFEEIKKINEDKIKNWINQCKKAIGLKNKEDYIIQYESKIDKKQIHIIDKATGRISLGTRWSHGLHEFIEVKEHLLPENESSTIASISHYSFYNKYKFIFGLTGTIGTDNERNEIKKMYHLDSYDVPTNFNIKRNILDTIMLDTNEQKIEKIKNEVIKYSKDNRPVLVIMSNIEQTLIFSEILQKENIRHKLLNDTQKEKEDSILHYGGKPGSIIVATIAAGRGTDIILNENSIKNGGLHVIFGYLPENRRIEFQGIGRAGRQGQPGSAQIIISRDEKNIIEKAMMLNKVFKNDEMKFIYNLREIINNELSEQRINHSKREKIYYEVLEYFFEFQKKLIKILNSPSYQNTIYDCKRLDYNYEKNNIIEKLRIDWATFFSELIDNNCKKVRVDDIFWNFLEKYNWIYIKNPIMNGFIEFIENKLK